MSQIKTQNKKQKNNDKILVKSIFIDCNDNRDQTNHK